VVRNGNPTDFNNDPRCLVEMLSTSSQNCLDRYNAGQTMQGPSIVGFVAGGVLPAWRW